MSSERWQWVEDIDGSCLVSKGEWLVASDWFASPSVEAASHATEILNALEALLDRAIEALLLVGFESDFGDGPEICWCPQGFLDGMPDDSEPDFHASFCKEIKAILADYAALKGPARDEGRRNE